MAGDCGGRVDLSRRSGTIVLQGEPRCTTLRSEIAVDRVDGHSVGREGELVYDAVAAHCAAQEAVTLEAGAVQVAVPCRTELKPRTPWLAVRR